LGGQAPTLTVAREEFKRLGPSHGSRSRARNHASWTGLGVGALVGILFPPSLLAGGAIGAAAGAVTGHLARGMSRGDMKDLGETLEGDAALVVVGESRIKEAIAKEAKRARTG
jgi:uncharacterized membrane protein